MKRILFAAVCAVIMAVVGNIPAMGQQKKSMYEFGDSVSRLVKMNYVYSLEDALKLSRQTQKPIFFNCFADWATPCHSMNAFVFSDEKFCRWMDENFVCLFMDVTEPEGKPLAEKYGIRSFVHYLVLNADGEVIHRIVTGQKLPEFQEEVACALNPKTSLAGTRMAYESGDHSKKTLRNYAMALRSAREDSLFRIVGDEYFSVLKEKEYSKKENWFIFTQKCRSIDTPTAQYLLVHKADFVKENGESTVNDFLSSLFCYPIYDYFTGQKPYDANEMLDLFLAMQKAGVPDSLFCYAVYDVTKLQCEKKYDELIDYFNTQGDKTLGYYRSQIETSVKFADPTEAQRANILRFYRDRQAKTEGSLSQTFKALADAMDEVKGMNFELGSFAQALGKAEQEGKLLFMDCFTTWCGPCKMMASRVFTDEKVGEYYNAHFVNLKMDMEKGEGIDLMKRYKVEAFPTMLILDAQGNELHRIVGYRDAEPFIAEAKKVVEK